MHVTAIQCQDEKEARGQILFFLLLPVWMKEDNTVLPKRSHSLVYCQILQNILRPSGLTSELLYCPWHIGCCRCDRSSILRGRIWPMHTAYTLTQVPLRCTSTPLPHSFYITAAVTGYFSDKDFTWKKNVIDCEIIIALLLFWHVKQSHVVF